MGILFIGANIAHKLWIGNFVGSAGDFIFGDEVYGVGAEIRPLTPCVRRPNSLARDLYQTAFSFPLSGGGIPGAPR